MIELPGDEVSILVMLEAIDLIEPHGETMTQVWLRNGRSLVTPVPYAAVRQLVMRAARLTPIEFKAQEETSVHHS